MDIEDMRGRTKERRVSFARQVFSYISRRYLHRRIRDIAGFLHLKLSAVSQGIRRFENLIGEDESKKEFIDEFLNKFKNKNVKCQT